MRIWLAAPNSNYFLHNFLQTKGAVTVLPETLHEDVAIACCTPRISRVWYGRNEPTVLVDHSFIADHVRLLSADQVQSVEAVSSWVAWCCFRKNAAPINEHNDRCAYSLMYFLAIVRASRCRITRLFLIFCSFEWDEHSTCMETSISQRRCSPLGWL